MKTSIALFIIIVSTVLFISNDNKVHIGDIQLPVQWGKEYVFNYQARNDNVSLKLYLVPTEARQRQLGNKVWAECRAKANQISKPELILFYKGVGKDKVKDQQRIIKHNRGSYNEDGSLTTAGHLRLTGTRSFASSRCLDVYLYGNTQFVIQNEGADGYSTFHVAKNGLGKIGAKHRVRMFNEIYSEGENVIVKVLPTEDDAALITDANPAIFLSVYIEEEKVRRR